MSQHFLKIESVEGKLHEAVFDIENVYNADDTGLFFRLGPNKTLATKSDRAKGIKKTKNGLRLYFATIPREQKRLSFSL